MICKNVKDYRWNFISYYHNRSPYSIAYKVRELSFNLREARKATEYYKNNGRYLSYALLSIISDKLNQIEKEQLIDYIVTIYCPIQFEELTKHYGSYEKMVLAIESNTGSEYDLKEDFNPDSESVYIIMKEILCEYYPIITVRNVMTFTKAKKIELFNLLNKETNAKKYQILKFLHLDKYN